MDSAEKKIFNIMQGRNQRDYAPIKDVLIDSFAMLEKLYNKKGRNRNSNRFYRFG